MSVYSYEDKLVQEALRQALRRLREAVFEPRFGAGVRPAGLFILVFSGNLKSEM